MITIDLFCLSVLFPLCGSYVTQENCFFQLEPYLGAFVRIITKRQGRFSLRTLFVCFIYLFFACLFFFLVWPKEYHCNENHLLFYQRTMSARCRMLPKVRRFWDSCGLSYFLLFQLVHLIHKSRFSLRGRRLKGMGKGNFPRAWSRALIPFPFPFERLPRRLE